MECYMYFAAKTTDVAMTKLKYASLLRIYAQNIYCF